MSLVLVPPALAQPAAISASFYDYLFSEARFSYGAARATDEAIDELVEAGAAIGADSAACILANKAVKLHNQAQSHVKRMGPRPEGSHQSPEWVRTRILEIDARRTAATERRTQLCAS